MLQHSLSLSSFVGGSPGAGLPPPRQQNEVRSVATIPDGHTVVVGGLEVVTDSDASNRVPVLGSVPVLGALFSSTNEGATRSRFFVFIRATILRRRAFEDLRHLSAVSADLAGVDDGFPPVRPRVIR